MGNYPELCSYYYNKLMEIECIESVQKIWSVIKVAAVNSGV